MRTFRKILIANRGEIAARIIRTAKRLGIETVLVHSQYDTDSVAAKLADELVLLTGETLAETYLNQEKIIEAAIKTDCEAIHPGYGFLSENESFANNCEKSNLVFIGPTPDSIHLMGNKLEAKKFAKNAGLPILEGYSGTAKEILKKTNNPEFPILVKASAGGGGKGMKIVHSMEELPQALESAEREALNYFGNGELYVERFITQPRHIEVQVLGDHFGNLVHLFERECTIQRRYQKIIEECPSPTLNQDLREKITSAAAKLCMKANYRNAGTIEFLLDENGNFYFLEMNTRIQVEHPVTEMATGIDLVEEQILIAAGNPLRFKQEEISLKGHAIECRIYAEDPWNNFLPAPGEMTLYSPPTVPGIRLDGAYDTPSTIYSFYDPMIAKVISHRHTREESVRQMIQALEEYAIHGIKTNIGYLVTLLRHPDFQNNYISTKFCELKSEELFDAQMARMTSEERFIPLIAYLIKSFRNGRIPMNVWEQIGFWRLNNTIETWLDCRNYLVEIISLTEKEFEFRVDEKIFYGNYSIHGNEIRLSLPGETYKVFISYNAEELPEVSFRGLFYPMYRKDLLRRTEFYTDVTPDDHPASANVKSPMPGKVVKVNKKAGDIVKKGELLVIIEAMKMENNIISPLDGKIMEIAVKPGDMVDSSSALVYFEEPKN